MPVLERVFVQAPKNAHMGPKKSIKSKVTLKRERMPVGESVGRSGAERGEDRNDPSHSRVVCDFKYHYKNSK